MRMALGEPGHRILQARSTVEMEFPNDNLDHHAVRSHVAEWKMLDSAPYGGSPCAQASLHSLDSAGWQPPVVAAATVMLEPLCHVWARRATAAVRRRPRAIMTLPRLCRL